MLVETPAPDGYAREGRLYLPEKRECFNRRPTMRGNRSRSRSGSLRPFSPSNITGAIDWWRADAGYTGAAWLGQKAGNDLAQAVAGQRGTSASDATLNNLTTLTLDGTDDYRRCTTVAPAAPGTTPTFIYMLVKHVAWVSGDALHAGGAGAFAVQPIGVTPALVISNPTNVNSNTGATVGSWKRIEASFTNTVGDFLHCGSTMVQGANAGNNAGSQITIGANNGLTAFASMVIYFYLVGNALPTVSELISLDGYLADRIGTTAPF